MVPILYFSISSYMVMAVIGLVVALLFLEARRKELGLTNSIYIEYLMICSLLALVFSKILFAISMIPSLETRTINELVGYVISGGIVFYGGLIGVITGTVVGSIKNKKQPLEILDMVAPAFPLFHTFARMGCLMAGCCYGVEWSWGVILADDPTIVRFPVQAIESICNLIIFVIIIRRERKKNTHSDNFLIYLGSYAVCRFGLEFFRGDTVRGLWLGGLSTSQYISICAIGVCAFLKAKEIRNRKEMSLKESM